MDGRIIPSLLFLMGEFQFLWENIPKSHSWQNPGPLARQINNGLLNVLIFFKFSKCFIQCPSKLVKMLYECQTAWIRMRRWVSFRYFQHSAAHFYAAAKGPGTECGVLFISYTFVKGFFAITFLLLVFSNWSFHDVYQRFFYITLNKISAWSDKNWEISPYTSIIKIAHFCNVMSIRYKSWQLL